MFFRAPVTPVTPTQYTNPAAVEQMRSRRSGVVVGATSGMTATPAVCIASRISAASSSGRSGRITPSTPAAPQARAKASTPKLSTGLTYVITASGMVTPDAREARTWSSAIVSVIPLPSATCPVRWMVGPSARGSLNGMPTSAARHPVCCAHRRRSPRLSRAGYPAVKYGISPGSAYLQRRARVMRTPRRTA